MDGKNDPSQRRTTIYDLARIAGTSPSAVSSVLNGSWQKRRISQDLADRIKRIAEEQGYATNIQASLLRRASSNIVGMIVPKYDNRYFGAVAEQFEALARERGLFPVITCTQREPELEIEAAKELISYQVGCLVATGATDPDRITDLCARAGVASINLDLPGAKAPSVISDNYRGGLDLTRLILDRYEGDLGETGPLYFIGGRASDHNTAERLRGFRDAHAERGIAVTEDHVLVPGYSAEKAERALTSVRRSRTYGLFVNSTISLEGVVRWMRSVAGPDLAQVRYGCFDWDPFAALMPGNVGMVQQDVSTMLERAFELIEDDGTAVGTTLVPCVLRALPGAAAAREPS